MTVAGAVLPAILIGAVVAAALVVLYVVTVVHITSDAKLQGQVRG